MRLFMSSTTDSPAAAESVECLTPGGLRLTDRELTRAWRLVVSFGIGALLLVAARDAAGQSVSDNFNRPDGAVGNGWSTWGGGQYSPDPSVTGISSGRLLTHGYVSQAGGIFRTLPVTLPVAFSFDFSTASTTIGCAAVSGSNYNGWLLVFNAAATNSLPPYDASSQILLLQYGGALGTVRYYGTPPFSNGDDAGPAPGQRDYGPAPAHISGQINANLSGTMTILYTDGLSPASVTSTFPAVANPPGPQGGTLILGNSSCDANLQYYFDNFQVGPPPAPVPEINQPLVPTAALPGGSGFTLTVNGTGFVSGSQVNWNGSMRATTFVSSSQLTAAITAADIAAAGTASVTVSTPSPGGGTSNVVFFQTTAPTSSLSFATTKVATGSQPLSVAAGDFNRDGKQDLAVVDFNNDKVSILLGNGDGTFQARVDYATGSVPYFVTIGDFNGDGKLDLAVANNTGLTVSILLGNGDGTFQPHVDYPAGQRPRSVIAGDFNGDGKLDLAVATNIGNTAAVLLGNGDGTFGPKVEYATGNIPEALAAGDFNGDGILDLAVVNFNDNTVSILLGNGDGTFKPKADYATGLSPYHVVAGDFNGDGKLDLAVANSGSNTVSILLGNGDGNGTFQAEVEYATGGSPFSVAMGDLNGDGIIDLAVADLNSNTVSVLLGNGNGSFQTKVDYATGSLPYSVTTGDFNGDGRLDLAAANYDPNDNTVSVLLQAPVVTLSATSLSFGNQNQGTTSGSMSSTLTNTGSATLNITGISLTGANAGDFAATNTCGTLPASFAPGAGCSFSVTFTPTAGGPRAGGISITDNATDSPQNIGLSGNGLASQTISFAPLSNRTFGDPDFTVGATASSGLTVSFSVGASDQCTISGTTVYTVHITGAGGCTVTAHQPGDGTTYSAAPDVPQAFSIAKAAATVTLSNLTPTYDGTPKAATATTNPIGLTVTVTYNNSATAPTTAGSYTVAGTISDNNYQGSANGTLTINQAPLTVTANNAARLYGSPNPSLGAAYAGFVSGQNQGVLAGTLNCATTAIGGNGAASPGSSPGNYLITCSGQSSINYNITYVPGTLTVTPAPLVALSPTSLTFSLQRVGTTSPHQNVTLTNAGTATLAIASIVASGDFAQTNGCPANLGIAAACTIHVTFTPTATGARAGGITLTDSAANSPQSVSLTGTGGVATIALTSASLTFQDRLINTTSAAQTVTLSNTGTVPLTSLSIAVSGDFTSSTCGTVAAGASCNINVKFRPTTTGARAGSVTVTGAATNSPQSIALSGNGINPMASLSAGTLAFGKQPLAKTSAGKTVTLTNSGTTPLVISSIAASGDFGETDNCPPLPASLAVNANCTIQVTFTPTATGSRTGKLTITDNAGGSPQSVSLSGNGTNAIAKLSASSLTFGPQTIGTTSAAQTITLQNTGTTSVAISSMVASGDFSRTQTCGGSVAPGVSCTISVKFKPTATGPRSGAVTITDDAADSPQVITLSGTGQ